MDNSLKQKLEKYFAHVANPMETLEVEAWLTGNENREEVNALMEQDLLEDATVAPAQKLRAFELLNKKINVLSRLNESTTSTLVVVKSLFSSTWLRVAASILLPIIGFVLYILLAKTDGLQQAVVLSTKDLQKKTWTLADGTKVVLKEGSELKIMPGFNKDKREVFLEGEAYLEVTKNISKPFVVNTSQIQVKVLGTKFNVASRAYNKEIKVFLEEGVVSLINLNDSHKHIKMKAGEYVAFQKETNQFSLSVAPTASPLLWKEKQLYINNEGFKQMVKKLEVWYDVSFHLPATIADDCKYMLMIQKESLPQVLQMVNVISPMTFTVQGKNIYIKDIKCK